jgi:hypothetical protein
MYKLSSGTIFLAIFIYATYALIVPVMGEAGDVSSWAEWANYIRQHGLSEAYGSGTNYLPGHLFELKIYSLFFNSKEAIFENIYFLKLFTFLFDVTGALLLCSLVTDSTKQNLILLVMLLNPAYIHNSILWGQFDSVFSTLCFAAFLAAYQNRLLLSSCLYLIALNFKLQAIIFLPAFILLQVYMSGLKIKPGTFIRNTLLLILIECCFLLPFFLYAHADEVLKTIKGQGGQSGWISLNAANIWQWLIAGGDLRWMSDRLEIHGMNLKSWGLVMTASGYLIALLPIGIGISNKWRRAPVNLDLLQISAIFALCALSFFFFNTQMHERYSFPAFLFIAAVAMLSEKWWLYGIFSVAYFLNNEMCLKSLKEYDYNSWIFNLRFSSALFFSTMVILLFVLYQSFYKRNFKKSLT